MTVESRRLFDKILLYAKVDLHSTLNQKLEEGDGTMTHDEYVMLKLLRADPGVQARLQEVKDIYARGNRLRPTPS